MVGHAWKGHSSFNKLKSWRSLPRACLIAGTLLLGLAVSPRALANADHLALEKQIWTSSLDNFYELERSAVRFLQTNPGAYEHYLIAELSLRMFRNKPADVRLLKQASDMSQQAIELAPNQEYGYLVGAQVLDLMGYKTEAVEMLADRPSFAKSWRTSFVRGLLGSLQEPDSSVFRDFAQSLQIDKASTEIVGFYLTRSLEIAYAGQDLVAELQQWGTRIDTSVLKLSLARALQDLGKNEEAFHILERLNKTAPSFEAKFAQATLLYSNLGRPKEAEALLLDVATHAGSDELKLASRAHLGKIALLAGDSKRASKFFQESIEGSSEPMKWINFSHMAYTESRRLIDFSQLLDSLSSTLPGSGFFYALQGEVLSESLAQHEKAVKSFASAISLDPKRSEFYNGMGLAYYRMNQKEKALSIFNQAIRIDPKDATARYNEACVLALMGRGEEAVGSLKQAISLDGRLQTLASKDADFASIRSNAAFQKLVQDSKITKAP